MRRYKVTFSYGQEVEHDAMGLHDLLNIFASYTIEKIVKIELIINEV